MNRPANSRKAELDLGRRSKQLAEDERGLVAPDRLAQTITEFIEWRAFSYWLRLIVETQGFVSESMIAILQERCPGFLEYAAAHAMEHPREPEFLWLRFLDPEFHPPSTHARSRSISTPKWMRFSDSSERLQTVNCLIAMTLNAVGMTQLAEPEIQGQPYLSGSKRTLRSAVLNFHRQNQCASRPRSAMSQ